MKNQEHNNPGNYKVGVYKYFWYFVRHGIASGNPKSKYNNIIIIKKKNINNYQKKTE